MAEFNEPDSSLGATPPPDPDRRRHLKSLTTYAFLLISSGAIAFQLRTGDRIDNLLPGLAELIGTPNPREALKKPPVDPGPPPMAAAEAQSFKAKADSGDAYAQFRTGVIYQFGLGGIDKNALEAVRYYRLAAAQNNWKAQTNLGLLLMRGAVGVPQDDTEAVRLLKLGVEAHGSVAQYWLAVMHHEGRGGLMKDDREAMRLLKLYRGAGGS